jgi:hypothetical protein
LIAIGLQRPVSFMNLRSLSILILATSPLGLRTQAEGPLPGKGLAQHPFLYCGEWQRRSTSDQTMYIVREGKIVWSYTNPLKGELGDCSML